MIDQWETKSGVDFLKRIGIGPGQRILDFGCGSGNYSIPTSIIAGHKGVVYAIDNDYQKLEELKRKLHSYKLNNIRTIQAGGEPEFPIESGSIDFVLLYDILHYFENNERKSIYEEVYRVLKNHGTMSVYPKHTKDDFPWDHFSNLTKEDVIKEIEQAGFFFKSKSCGHLMHYGMLENGCVFNFGK